MIKTPRICVVGSINVDLTFRTPRLPGPGETLAGHAFHMGMGGKGANQAVAARRLGAAVTLVARVGNNAFGQEAVSHFRTECIDTSLILTDQDRPTGIAAIVVDDHAENSIIVVAGANAGLSPDDIRQATVAIQGADVLMCQLETPVDATLEAFRLARAVGVRTILTPAPAAQLPDDLFRLCDLCIPNESELQLLAGGELRTLDDVAAAAQTLRKRGIGIVIVTLGSRGAMIVTEDGSTHIPATPVEAVDQTGAGDAFTAAVAVGLGSRQSVVDAARRASLVAALTVTRIGTQTAFPFLAEVEAWQPGMARAVSSS